MAPVQLLVETTSMTKYELKCLFFALGFFIRMELPKKVAEIETVLCRFHRYLRVAGKKDGTFLLNIIRKIKELN